MFFPRSIYWWQERLTDVYRECRYLCALVRDLTELERSYVTRNGGECHVDTSNCEIRYFCEETEDSMHCLLDAFCDFRYKLEQLVGCCRLMKISWWTPNNDAIITSSLRQNDVATSFWRNTDIMYALFVHWDTLTAFRGFAKVHRWRSFNIYGLLQDCSIPSALAVEIQQSCTKPSILSLMVTWKSCWTKIHNPMV